MREARERSPGPEPGPGPRGNQGAGPGPVAAVVLAAGASRRMGRPKLLLPWRGTTVIGHVVETALQAPVDRVVAVLGANAALVAGALARFQDSRLRLVTAPDHTAGMLASIQAGVEAIPEGYGSFLLALGDQPTIRPDTWRTLAASWPPNPRRILIPTCGGRRGHPTLIPLSLRNELLGLGPGQHSLRTLLERHSDSIDEVPVDDPGIRADVDTPEDYAQLAKEG